MYSKYMFTKYEKHYMSSQLKAKKLHFLKIISINM